MHSCRRGPPPPNRRIAPPTYGFIISGADDLQTANQAQDFSFCYRLRAVDTKYRGNLSGDCTATFGGADAGGSGDLDSNN